MHRHLTPLLPSLFLAFRLVYIPASVLSHTGHGLPWLTAAAGLAATFGMEALARRGRTVESAAAAPSHMAGLILALLIVGLFPEEAPIGLLLWAGIGAMGARLLPKQGGGDRLAGLLSGGLLGLTGLFGPGSWLLAGLLLLWWWNLPRT